MKHEVYAYIEKSKRNWKLGHKITLEMQKIEKAAIAEYLGKAKHA